MNTELEKWNQLLKHQNQIYHQYAKKINLTEPQFWILYALCETKEPLFQNIFCENWTYNKQTVSASVSSLEKSGLVTLSFAKGSRKKKQLHLTAKGEDFCNQYIRTLQHTEEKILGTLSQKEKDSFFNTLSLLLTGLENELT